MARELIIWRKKIIEFLMEWHRTNPEKKYISHKALCKAFGQKAKDLVRITGDISGLIRHHPGGEHNPLYIELSPELREASGNK